MVGLHAMYVHHDRYRDDGLHEMFTTAYLSTPATKVRTRRGGTKRPIVTQKARDSEHRSPAYLSLVVRRRDAIVETTTEGARRTPRLDRV